MASVFRGSSDGIIDEILETLRLYEADHPRAQTAVYRQNPVSVRVRIVDPDFAKLDRSERSRLAWKYLDEMSDEAQADISTLLLLAPTELEDSFANVEFENPLPSVL